MITSSDALCLQQVDGTKGGGGEPAQSKNSQAAKIH